MKLTRQQQENYLYDMKEGIDKIRACRIETGEETKDFKEIWEEISYKYDMIDEDLKQEFNNYLN